jgi:hypothetical protein
MAESNQPYDPVGLQYSPVDFPDVEQPVQHTLTNTVNNVALYHVSDAVDRQYQTKAWKKKIRDIIQNHQERILQFFTKPLPSDHPLKVAHLLLTKYGKPLSLNFDLAKNPPGLFKDFLVDTSGQGFQALNVYLADLEKARVHDPPLNRWANMTRHMLDYMRDVGDELLRIDQKLQSECSLLDTVVDKITHLSGLGNPGVDGFEAMMELYVAKQFEKHPIEHLYWDYIHTVQKYSGLREILMPQRMSSHAEPVCCICMTEVASTVFVPCGHIFCMNCSKRATQCHVCRQAVTTKVRLYFS